MAENVLQLGVNTDTKKAIDIPGGNIQPKSTDILRLIYGERPVIATTFQNKEGTAVAFDANDTFEMDVDIDFSHDDLAGTLNASYTGAIVSIAITFTEDITGIRDTGALTLKDTSNPSDRESVDYTAVVISGVGNTIGTFTVSKTLVNSYASGDYGATQDRLMAQATESDVNTGEWTAADKTAGKVSFRLDCRDVKFSEKLTLAGIGVAGNDFEGLIYVEIKRYPTGSTIPIVLLQDTIYGRQTVRDNESVTIPSDENWTAADARYQQVYANMSDIGEALADDDDIYVDNTSGSSSKSAVSRIWTYISAKLVALSLKGTPAGADSIPIVDSEDSNALKRMTITALQAVLTMAASAVTYVNTASKLVATDAQAALDEINLNHLSSGSTALTYGGELSINADTTKFDMAAGSGYVMDSYTTPGTPTFTKVTWTAFTAQAVTNIATQPITFISVDSAGAIVQTAVAPSGADRRDYIVIGLLVHDDLVDIRKTSTAPTWNNDHVNTMMDVFETLGGAFNRSGNIYSSNGANLNIDKSAGEAAGAGRNYDTSKKNPNIKTISSGTAVVFPIFHRATPVPAVTNAIPVTQYDPAGAGLVSIPTDKFVAHRIYLDPATDETLIQYGQYAYDSLIKATNASAKDAFTRVSAVTNLVCRCILVVQEGATDLSDPLEAKFIELGVMGDRNLQSIPSYSRFGEVVELGDGLSYQQQDIELRLSGGVIYADIQAVGGGDIDYLFGQREYPLDCTGGAGPSGEARKALTAGTDVSPQENYVYVTHAADVAVLSASTSRPTGEFAYVGKVILPSTTLFNTDGAYSAQEYTDSKELDGRSAVQRSSERLRILDAVYETGIVQTVGITTNVGTPDNIDFDTTAGSAWQKHLQTFPAFDVSTDGLFVINHNATPYTKTTDLNTLLTDANGNSLSGTRFSFVIWGNVSKSTGECKLFLNLPIGSYGSNADALADPDNLSVTTIPKEYRGTGFLIGRVVMRHQTLSGGTWTNIALADLGTQTIDLRGSSPGYNSGGAGVPASSTFSDALFSLFNTTDNTKLLSMALSAITTGTTRTWTAPDADVNIGSFPASSVDNTIPRYDGTTGKIIQGSGVSIDDSDNMTIPGYLSAAQSASSTPSIITRNTAVSANGGGGIGLYNDHTPGGARNWGLHSNVTAYGDFAIVQSTALGGNPFSAGTKRLYFNASGGVMIGDTTSSGDAILELTSTTQGFVPPRMTTTQRDAIGTPMTGLIIYNTTTSQLERYDSTWGAVGPAGSGEANTASNVGGFVDWFKQKTGVDLEFKTAQSTDATLSFTANTSDVDITVNKTKALQPEVNVQTGTTYTGVLADGEKIVSMDNAATNVFTIPANAAVAYDVNTTITVLMKGAGVTSVTADTGVTVNGVSTGSATINGQYQAVTILKVATDTWIMFGAHGTVA